MDNLTLTSRDAAPRPTCTAIVCAYNEEKTIGKVIEALSTAPMIDEIIVVDDGSTDSTPAFIRKFAQREHVIGLCFEQNHGKSYAMAAAAEMAHGDSLLFVDADLYNWSADYTAQLLQPLYAHEADMVIGYAVREDVKRDPDRYTPFLHWLAGQRAVWREDFLPLLDTLRSSRFGVETLINLHYRQRQQRIACRPLHGLFHPAKAEKHQPLQALQAYAREGYEIAQAVAQQYPLALAAYGFKPMYVDRMVHFDVRPPTEQLVQWTRQTLLRAGQWFDRMPGNPILEQSQ